MTKFKIGDKVAYSAAWLRSVGAYCGDLPHARGTITELKPLGSTTLASVDWDNPDVPAKVNAANLAKVGPNPDFCAS